MLPHEAPGGGGPGRVLELVLDLLTALERPVLLVLEDIHWADRSTLALLAFLARNLRAQPLVVLATYRVDDELSYEVRRLAGELRRRRTVISVELAPLTRDDVARQLEAIAGGPVPAALADEVHARAGGNPFFAEELFAATAGAGTGRAGAWRARCGGPRGGGGATRCAAARARRGSFPRRSPTRCSRGSQRLDARALAVLAAAGGRASFALLDALAVDPDAMRGAEDAGVLVRERDGVAFRHGLIGEVLYERLLPSERAELHRRIAARLDDPAQRAHHCQRAGMRAEALDASIEAGRRAAAVFAYAEAAVHFERALELAPPTGRRCSPARPRRRASAATRSARSRAAARRSSSRPIPPLAPACSSGSASTSSGTTRPRSGATRRRCGSRRASRGCWRPRATR